MRDLRNAFLDHFMDVASTRKFFGFKILVYLCLSTSLYFVISAPLIADDFITIFEPINQQTDIFSVGSFLQKVFYLIEFGTHVNLIGQTIGLIFMNSWLNFAIYMQIPLFMGYVILRVTLWGFLLHSSYCTAKLFVRFDSRSRVYFFATFACLLQIHALWSSDPITSFPFAGLLASTFLFYSIFFSQKILINDKSFHLLLLIPLNIVVFSLYEMNICLVLYQVLLISHLYRSQVKQFSFCAKAVFCSVLPTVFNAFTALTFAKQKHLYSGTSFNFEDIPKVVVTFIFNLLSVVPYFSWSFSVSQKFGIHEYLWMINFFVVLGTLIFFFFIRLHTSASFRRNKEKESCYDPYYPLVSMALGSTIVQSTTLKVQNETSGPHSVYIFHLNLLVCAVVLGTVFLVKFSEIERKRTCLSLFLAVAILLQTCQNGVQNVLLSREFAPNMRIINSLTEKVEISERCRILEEWQARDWPREYADTLNSGIDYFSLKVQGEKFCPIR